MDGNTKRLAVVIGNSNYENLTSLANPINDANAIKDALHFLGYEVTLNLNLRRGEILKKFTNVLDSWKYETKEIVVYYSGHGVSINGKSYIGPIDADDDIPVDLVSESFLSVETIIRLLLNHRKDDKFPIIVILDCCRSKIMSDITHSHYQGDLSQSVGGEFGTESNIAIMYSTADGQVTLDGSDGSDHSPYTQILLENIVKDLTINEINAVITRTLGESNGKQVSWMYQCLYEPYRFCLPKSPINPRVPPTSNDTAMRRFYGIPSRNYNFVNRPKIISAMEAFLGEKISTSSGNILVLNGLGGMGKTQLMLRYCHLHHEEYDYIFWLEADGRIMTLDSFQKLAVNLGLDEETIKEKYREEKIMDWVCAWLEKRSRWLLLLDNVDKVMGTELLKILPQIGGDIILTTREYIPPTMARVIPIYKMDKDEALTLLLNAQSLDSGNQTYAKEIVVELDSMPLAIAIARAYINNMQISFKDYLSIIKNQRDEFFSQSDEDNAHQYSHTLSTVWKLSLKRVRTVDPVAGLILDICVFFQPDNIPVRFFKQFPLFEQELTSSKSEKSEYIWKTVRTAISVLVKFSFVTRILKKNTNNEDGFFIMHRLVQTVISNEMNDEQKIRLAYIFAKTLNNEIKFSDHYATSSLKIMNIYLPHIRKFTTLLSTLKQNPLLSIDLEELLVKTANYLLDHGVYVGVEVVAKIAVSVSGSLHGQNSFSKTIPLTILARSYQEKGIYADAQLLYQQALEIREKTLGPNHSDTVSSLNNLASLYECQGKYSDAEQLYRRAVIINENILGPVHLDTAISLSNLASLCKIQRKYSDAEQLYRRVLTIKGKALKYHPLTTTSLNELASLYKWQGRYADAEPLYQRALKITEKMLGPEHPNLVTYLNNLALLYSNQGRYTDAEPLYQRVLIIKEKALGPEHLDVMISLNHLVLLYKNQGRYADAESLYRRALMIMEKTGLRTSRYGA